MKKTILTAVALCAAFAFAGYNDWYTPAQKFNEQNYAVAFIIDGKAGAIAERLSSERANIRVALEGAVGGMDLSANAKNAFALAKEALVEAIYAEFLAERNKQKIDSLGASVETIFQLTSADKVDSSGAVISSGKLAEGVRAKMLAKKNSLIGGGGIGGAGDDGKPLQITVTDFNYDPNEFEQISMSGGKKSKMGLKGYSSLNQISTGSFPYSGSFFHGLGWWIPYTEGKGSGDETGQLKWTAWGGFSSDVFDMTTGEDAGKVILKDWDGGTGGCELNLSQMLTEENDADYIAARSSHDVLMRCKDGGEYKLHYMKIGDVISSSSSNPPDEATIETYIQDDGSTNIVLYGSYEANEQAAESETDIGFIPYVDGGDTLAWAGLSEFFSDTVFDTSESGRIILNGIKEGDDEVHVLAIKGRGDAQEVEPVRFDKVSIDGSIEDAQVIQLHNFATAPSPYGVAELTFADALTNNSATISGMSIPVRFPSDKQVEIGYIPMGKITGIPSASVDDLTIEATPDEDGEPDKLRIVGSKEATKGQLLKMGENGRAEWGGLTEGDVPLLKTDSPPYNPIYLESEDDGSTYITLNGWSGFDIGAFVYGTHPSSGIPTAWSMENCSGLDIGYFNGFPKLDIEGFEEAYNNSIPYKSGSTFGSLEWKSPPSGASESQPKALAYNGSSLVWKDIGGHVSPAHLIVEGVDGDTVTTATCTNKISFVSDENSNVKFTVTDKGNGNVEVKVGVYYK